MKLNKQVCDNAQYQGKGGFYCLWDETLPGFGLRITPIGKKTFIIKYRISNKQTVMKIADYGRIPVDEARKIARKKMALTYDGHDPMQERKKKAKSLTFGQLCEKYINEHAKVKKKSWDEDKRRIDRFLVPKFGNKESNKITRNHISSLHAEIGAQGAKYEANRVLATISSIFSFGISKGYLPEDMANPARFVEKYKEQPRTRWLDDEAELKSLLKAIHDDENPYYRALFLLLMLTGMRKGELQNLRWDQVDLTRGKIFFSDTKSGYEETKELSIQSIKVFQEIPHSEGAFVFPGKKPNQPIVNVDKAWRRIRDRAGLTNLRIHDLRRSFVSLMVNADVSLLVASKAAGHRSTKITEQVYARLRIDPIKEAINKIGDHISQFSDDKV